MFHNNFFGLKIITIFKKVTGMEFFFFKIKYQAMRVDCDRHGMKPRKRGKPIFKFFFSVRHCASYIIILLYFRVDLTRSLIIFSEKKNSGQRKNDNAERDK